MAGMLDSVVHSPAGAAPPPPQPGLGTHRLGLSGSGLYHVLGRASWTSPWRGLRFVSAWDADFFVEIHPCAGSKAQLYDFGLVNSEYVKWRVSQQLYNPSFWPARSRRRARTRGRSRRPHAGPGSHRRAPPLSVRDRYPQRPYRLTRSDSRSPGDSLQKPARVALSGRPSGAVLLRSWPMLPPQPLSPGAVSSRVVPRGLRPASGGVRNPWPSRRGSSAPRGRRDAVPAVEALDPRFAVDRGRERLPAALELAHDPVPLGGEVNTGLSPVI